MNPIKMPFHRALLAKEWQNSRGLILAFAGLITYMYPVSLLLGLSTAAAQEQQVYPHIHPVVNRVQLGTDAFSFTLFTFVIVVFLAAELLGRERRGNAVSFLLAMPFSRTEILFNKYLLGVVGVAATYLLNGLLLAVIIGRTPGLETYLDLLAIAQWADIQVVLVITGFSFALFFAAVTGHSLAAVILTVIYSIFPMGFVGLVQLNLANVVGWSWSDMSDMNVVRGFLNVGADLSLLNYFGDPRLALTRWPLLLIAGILFAVLAHGLFSRNPMERNGELLVFPQLEPILRIGVTFCTMILVGGGLAVVVGNPQPQWGGLLLSGTWPADCWDDS